MVTAFTKFAVPLQLIVAMGAVTRVRIAVVVLKIASANRINVALRSQKMQILEGA